MVRAILYGGSADQKRICLPHAVPTYWLAHCKPTWHDLPMDYSELGSAWEPNCMLQPPDITKECYRLVHYDQRQAFAVYICDD